MRKRVPALALVTVVMLGSLRAADQPEYPKPGSDLPGSFQVLSVTPEKSAGRFHCPVCENGLSPGVLLFLRAEPDSLGEPLTNLLKMLDAQIGKHPDARLGVCAIFLNDGGYRETLETKSDELGKATEFKDERGKRIKDLAKSADLKQVALSLGSVEGPKGYKIDKDAELTILVYNRLEVVAYLTYSKEKLSNKDIEAIQAQVEKLLSPKKK